MAGKPSALNESSSLLLDIIRLSAALLVVISHLSRPEFAVVLNHNLQFLGDLAVPIFFVLSGFVIRFVTVSREQTLREYLSDRASRIYSVAVPALGVSLGVAAIVYLANRRYAMQFLAPLMNHPTLRVLANVTFLSQVWGFNTVQFADPPFWSLSYECLFYVAYGFINHLRGSRRIVALSLWAAVAGPPVLFLFPLWLLGCVLHDVYMAISERPVAAILRWCTLLYSLLAFPLAALHHGALLLAAVDLDRAIAGLPNPLSFVHQGSIRATMLAIANGTISAVAMLFLLLLADLVPLSRNHPFARRFRRLADGTFAIYLMHYPLMMLARSLGLLRPHAPLLDAATVTMIVLLLIGLAAPLDALKLRLRKFLDQARIPARESARGAVHVLR